MRSVYSLDSVAGADIKQAVYGYLMEHELKTGVLSVSGDTWSDIAAARMCGFPAIAVLYGDGGQEAAASGKAGLYGF